MTIVKCDRLGDAGAYVGVEANEAELLVEYFAAYSQRYDLVDVNVRVGEGRACEPDDSAATRKMWSTITKRRVDALAWRGNDIDVIEAKVIARAPAATQVLRYVPLVRYSFPLARVVRPVIVCRAAPGSIDVALRPMDGRVERFPLPALA